MAKDVIMPKFGFTQETAELLRWLKQPGDPVEQGDPIAEVTTDKVDMEVEATASGVLADLRFKAGDVVPVTAVIAVIRERGEEDREQKTEDREQKTADGGQRTQDGGQRTEDGERRTADGGPRTEDREQRTEAKGRVTPVAARLAQDHGVEPSQLGGTGLGGRITRGDVQAYLATKPPEGAAQATDAGSAPDTVRAVPAARKLAQSLGVDLADVPGSGPQGRVQSGDVRATHAALTSSASLAEPPPPNTDLPAGVTRVIPLVGMRRTIAQRLQQSYQQAPHITFDVDADVTAAEALRRHPHAGLVRGGDLPWSSESGPRISLTAVLVRACAWALRRHPLLNSRLVGESIEVLADVHIGVAVALDDGLMVPVVRDADRKGILQIASEISDLASRARSGSLRPDDVSGGTFTISNLGMFGVDRFTAILNPPQTGILAVGQVRRQFVPDEQDRPVVRPLMALRLSADHRVVDGAVAARFLSDLRAAVEQPGLMSL